MRSEIDVVLFDFGGTLAEEVDTLFLADDVPKSWIDIWNARFEEPDFVHRWERGELRANELIEDLARRFGCAADVVLTRIRNRCKYITFHRGIMTSVRARKRRSDPQALVTVNPDLFDLIAEHYRLHDLFDAIVLSAHEGTIDKVELCRVALDRLGRSDLASALLIDNVREQIQAFENAGGNGYRFIDDETFGADVAMGRLPPSLAS